MASVGKEMIIPIAQIAPKVGDEVQLVGWGKNLTPMKTITRKRHHGRNTITAIVSERNDRISFRSKLISDGGPEDFSRSGANKGDSGGPLYNLNNELIGINSILFANETDNVSDSDYMNVTHPAIKKYIDDTLKSFSDDPGALSAEQNNFQPICSPNGLRKGKTVFQNTAPKAPEGFMKVTKGEGFRCLVDLRKYQSSEYPTCQAACADQKQTEEILGTCPTSSGYECKNQP